MTVKGVLLHESDSPPYRGDTAATIHRWHREKGYDGIGYHYVILEDGMVENGRPHYWHGAHEQNANKTHLGILYIGNGEPTQAQINSMIGLISNLQSEYGFGNDQILGHYELDKNKVCPGFNMDKFRQMYEERIG